MVAADVIYGGNSEVWHLFVETLTRLTSEETIVLFEITERYAQEKRVFMHKLRKFGWMAHKLPDRLIHPHFQKSRVSLFQLKLIEKIDFSKNNKNMHVGRLHKKETKEQKRIREFKEQK